MKNKKIDHGRVVVEEQNPSSDLPAWEMIEAGRYQPRRIRGSFRGRVLG